MKKIVVLILAFIVVFSSFTYAETDEPSSWAEGSVEELKAYNEFRSNAFTNYKENITRQEFIYLAVRIYELFDGKEITPDPSISFTDTTDIYALKGATVGITSGIGNGQFGPDMLLTREQLSVLMMNVLKIGNVEQNAVGSYKFNDENEFSSWAKDSIYSAKANDIINGVGNDTFNPQGNATKEVAIIITNKILKNNKGKQWANADGQIAHIIDLTTAGSGESVPASEMNFQTDSEFIEIMSKYGVVNEEGTTKIFTEPNGLSYYSRTADGQQHSSLTIIVQEENLIIQFKAYNETIQNVVIDFMDHAYASENGYRDAVVRIFQDIESTKVVIEELNTVRYSTGLLDDKTVVVDDVTMVYDETSSAFVVYFNY